MAVAAIVTLFWLNRRWPGLLYQTGGLSNLGTFAGTVIFLVSIGLRRLGWPTFFPVASSVDAAHHGAMVDWIARNGRLPNRIEPELKQFSEYFLLPHRLAAGAANIFGISPMRALGLSGLVALMLVLVVCSSLAERVVMSALGRWEGVAAAFLAFPCALLIPRFITGALFESYFFGQVVALAFGACACIGIATGSRPAVIILIGAASIAAYPLQGPLVPGVLFVVAVLYRDRRATRTLLGVLILGVGALGAQYPYLGASQAMSSEEGSITKLTLSTGGGLFFLSLVATGLYVVAKNLRTTARTRAALPSVVLAAGFALTALQYFLFRVAAALDLVSYYSAGKIVFMVAPFAVTLSAIGGVFVLSTLLRRQGLTVAAAALASAIFLALAPNIKISSEAPMDPDAYALARWARNHHLVTTNESVGVVGSGLTPYFVRWTALGQPIDAIQYLDFDRRLPWRSWPKGSSTQYLIVAGDRRIEAYLSRQDVRGVARRGNAVLLKRESK